MMITNDVLNSKGRKAADLLMGHSIHESPDPEGFRDTMEEIVDKYLKKGVKLESVINFFFFFFFSSTYA